MSVKLIYINGRYTINTSCEIGDITLESYNRHETDIIIVTKSSWLSSTETEDINGIFSIKHTSSVRFFNLIFNLPSSSLLGEKPFIYHYSSGLLILEDVFITSETQTLNKKNENILRNEDETSIMSILSESLIKIRNGNVRIERCIFSNMNLQIIDKNKDNSINENIIMNGSVINAVIQSRNILTISESKFKNCIISKRDIDVDTGTDTNTDTFISGYGGAIYIEIKEEGSFIIEDENEYTFDSCNILMNVKGYGGAIALYLNDNINDSNIKFISVFFFLSLFFY
jgi:hypothetical protein